MTIEELRSMYLERVRQISPESAFADLDARTIDRTVALAHVHWMLNQIPFLDHERQHWWLGFVQGVLWLCGEYSIHDLRSQSKPLAG